MTAATPAERAWLAARAAGDPQADFDDLHPAELARRIHRFEGRGGEHDCFRAMSHGGGSEASQRAREILEDHYREVCEAIARRRALTAAEERHVRIANAVFLVRKDAAVSLVPWDGHPGSWALDEGALLEESVP